MLALCEDEGVIGTAFYLMRMSTAASSGILALPDLNARTARRSIDAMNEALARCTRSTSRLSGCSDFGKPGSYFARQLQRWGEQYRASETERVDDMDRLIVWLGANVPADDGRVSLVHGDWRIDNMIFDPHSPRLLAVLDWELSTLGHPFADLAYQCMQWRLPNEGAVSPASTGSRGDPDRGRTMSTAYCRRAGLERRPRLDLPHRLQLLSASRRSPRACTSARSTATPPIPSAPANMVGACR